MDSTIRGEKVFKGDRIMIPINPRNFAERDFSNADKFDQTRFDQSNKEKIPNSVYIPFGSGRRIFVA